MRLLTLALLGLPVLNAAALPACTRLEPALEARSLNYVVIDLTKRRHGEPEVGDDRGTDLRLSKRRHGKPELGDDKRKHREAEAEPGDDRGTDLKFSKRRHGEPEVGDDNGSV